MTHAVNTSKLGFAEHHNPGTMQQLKKAEKLHSAAKWSWIATVAIASVLATLAGVGIIFWPISLAAILAIGITHLSLHLSAWLHKTKELVRTIGILNRSDTDIHLLTFDYTKNANAIVMKDGMQTHKFRLEMIKHAEHSVVISGNLCAGKALKEVLEAIKTRIKEKSDLKVIILAVENFSYTKEMKQLAKKHPKNFAFVDTPPTVFRGGKKCLQIGINHSKALIVDGKLAIVGGSNLQDGSSHNYRATVEGNHAWLRRKLPKDEKDPSRKKNLIASRFSDMDVAFESDNNGYVTELYHQIVKLAYQWEKLTQYKKHGKTHETLVDRMLKNDYDLNNPDPTLTKTTLQEIQDNVQDGGIAPIRTVKVEGFYIGPTHKDNHYMDALIDKVKKTQKRIFICNQYTYFSKDFRKALAEKLKAGVQVTIISNGWASGISPGLNQLFVEHNRQQIRKLVRLLDENSINNLKYYEVTKYDETYHKKIYVFDDTVFAGASNISYKSLNMTDTENNFKIESQELAEDTCRVLEKDIQRAIDVSELPSSSIGAFFKRSLFYLLLPVAQ